MGKSRGNLCWHELMLCSRGVQCHRVMQGCDTVNGASTPYQQRVQLQQQQQHLWWCQTGGLACAGMVRV